MDSWMHEDYDSMITEEKWLELFKDPDIFNENSLIVMRCFLDYDDGSATCKQLAEAYGRTHNFYNMTSSNLAERVHKKTGCPLIKEPPNRSRSMSGDRFWPILYVGKYTENKEDGYFIWRLRPELKSALTSMIIAKIEAMQQLQR